MNRFRSRAAALLATLAVVAAAPIAGSAASGEAGHLTTAKSCGNGYKHAVIGGKHKCLRRGQYCSRSRKSEYPKYGYHCNKKDYRGRWHLT